MVCVIGDGTARRSPALREDRRTPARVEDADRLVGRDGAPEPLPVDPQRLGPGQIVVDLVYHPAVTPLLQAVRARGIRGINGVGMLIHQAAHAFRLWTKEEPPLEAMSAAALAALLQRERDSD